MLEFDALFAVKNVNSWYETSKRAISNGKLCLNVFREVNSKHALQRSTIFEWVIRFYGSRLFLLQI